MKIPRRVGGPGVGCKHLDRTGASECLQSGGGGRQSLGGLHAPALPVGLGDGFGAAAVVVDFRPDSAVVHGYLDKRFDRGVRVVAPETGDCRGEDGAGGGFLLGGVCG